MYLCAMADLNNIKRMSDGDIVRGLGGLFKDYRIAFRLTQSEVSAKSGVSVATIKRFETGQTYNITLGNFIALLKTIDQIEGLREVLPEIPPSPYAMDKQEKSKLMRVRHGK